MFPTCPAASQPDPRWKETKLGDIREAVELHLEAMREVGEPIPAPTTDVDFVELPVVA